MSNKRIRFRSIIFNKSTFRAFFYLFILLAAIVVTGCSRDPDPLAQAEITITPTMVETVRPTSTPTIELEATLVPPSPTATSTPKPSETPSPEMAVESPVASETAVLTPTITPDPNTPTARDDGKVFLNGEVILDIQTEAPSCYPDISPEIPYSPTKEHFLVIPFCIEGDNLIFIFQADGTGKKEVTGPWDYLNGLNYEWSPDGQSFTYERIDSCCLAQEDIPADAPARGLVRYDVVTGEKALIATPTPRP